VRPFLCTPPLRSAINRPFAFKSWQHYFKLRLKNPLTIKSTNILSLATKNKTKKSKKKLPSDFFSIKKLKDIIKFFYNNEYGHEKGKIYK